MRASWSNKTGAKSLYLHNAGSVGTLRRWLQRFASSSRARYITWWRGVMLGPISPLMMRIGSSTPASRSSASAARAGMHALSTARVSTWSTAGGNSGRSLYGWLARQVIFKVSKFIDTKSFLTSLVSMRSTRQPLMSKKTVFFYTICPEVPCVGCTDENDCDSITVPAGTLFPRNCGRGCPGICVRVRGRIF